MRFYFKLSRPALSSGFTEFREVLFCFHLFSYFFRSLQAFYPIPATFPEKFYRFCLIVRRVAARKKSGAAAKRGAKD